MASTRTGNLPIGFRRGGSSWQQDLSSLLPFAQQAGFEVLDLPALPVEDLKQVQDAGLRVGTVDLPPPWADLICDDEDRRHAATDRCASYIRELAELGIHHFFTVLLPADPSLPRGENLEFAVSAYRRLCAAIEDTQARIVLEGFPGPPPYFGSLACTPADFRLFDQRVGSPHIAINFDPSHLVRMRIDPHRFVDEFHDRIYHVHAKDTEILDEALYEHGDLQPATETPVHGFGAHHWRYAIPGHGVIRWRRLFEQLSAAGYQGPVCIELEDEHFNGSTDGEQRGLTASRDFLVNV